MRVLVTGGAGFVGSHIVDRYVEAGYDVHIVDNLISGKTSNINNKVTLHEIDICSDSFSELLTNIKPDAVNHHAAQASVKISVLDPKHDLLINGSGTANIAMLSAMHGVKHLIYASSGGTLYGQPLENPVNENAEIKPLSPYGVSKFAGEEYVKFVARSSEMNTTIFRYGNVFGPRQDPSGEAGVIAIFAGNFSTDISLIGQIPKSEFKEEGVPTGFGLDLNGLWYPVEELGFGLNLGGTQYGSSKRSIPFNYFTLQVSLS